jgi:hypothetical protein
MMTDVMERLKNALGDEAGHETVESQDLETMEPWNLDLRQSNLIQEPNKPLEESPSLIEGVNQVDLEGPLDAPGEDPDIPAAGPAGRCGNPGADRRGLVRCCCRRSY